MTDISSKKNKMIAALIASSLENSRKRKNPPVDSSSYNLKHLKNLAPFAPYLLFDQSNELSKVNKLKEFNVTPNQLLRAESDANNLYNIYDSNNDHVEDEPINLAAYNSEKPSESLLEYIKYMAKMKAKNQGKSDDFINKFSDSSFISTGILLEEIIRESILNWKKTGSFIDSNTTNQSDIQIAAQIQLNGSVPHKVTNDILKNRLEVLFNNFHENNENFNKIDKKLIEKQLKSYNKQFS